MDVVAHAKIWGAKEEEQPTCFAPNAKKGTRRYYIFLSAQMASRVKAYRVHSDASYLVHRPIAIRMTTRSLNVTKWRLAKPCSAKQLMDERGEQEEQKPWVPNKEEGRRTK